MKNLLLFFAYIFTSFYSFSQIDHYSQRYNLDTDLEAMDMVLNPDNGVVVVGRNELSSGIISYKDEYGQVLWTRKFSNSDNNYQFNKVIMLHDSTFVAVGSTYNTIWGRYGAACVRIDRFGDTLWTKSLDNTTPFPTTAYDVIELKDSSILVSGAINGAYAFAIKLDISGQKIWGKTYQNDVMSPDYSFVLLAAKEHQNNDLIYCGRQFNSGTSKFVGFVLKTDGNGDVLWSKSIELDNNSSFNDVLIDDSNYYFLNTLGFGGVVKTDTSLNVIWNNGFNYISDPQFESVFELLRMHDSTFIMIGPDDFAGTMVNFDKGGNCLKSAHIEGVAMKVLEDKDSALVLLSNGPIYGIKSSLLFQKHYGLSKIDTLFNTTAMCVNNNSCMQTSFLESQFDNSIVSYDGMYSYNTATAVDTVDLIVTSGCVEFFGSVDELEKSDFIIFPNPVADELSIVRADQVNEVFYISDQSGRMVIEGKLNDLEETVETKKLISGLYFMTIGQHTEKFIKE